MDRRRRAGRCPAVALLLTVVVAGCGGAVASPAPSSSATNPAPSSPAPSATGSTPTSAITPSPSPTAAPISLYLRAWAQHASIGPINSFGNVPRVISDGQLLAVPLATGAAVPLFSAPERRSLSPAALETIVAEARNDGLLGTVTTFPCPPSGGEVIGGPGPDFLVIGLDGVIYQLSATCATARPSLAPGTPEPATWAAFQHFKALLADPSGWLGAEIGPAVIYDPDRLAVLVMPVEAGAPTPPANQLVSWPLAGPFTTFGAPFAGARCAVVSDADVAPLLAAVKPVGADTVFRDGTGALATLIVRPFMPGEPNPCSGF